MREDNAGDTPRARTSSDLDSPAATQFDKKGNISIVINSGVNQRSQKWSQRSPEDPDVVGRTIRKDFIHEFPKWWRSMLLDSAGLEDGIPFSALSPVLAHRHQSCRIPN